MNYIDLEGIVGASEINKANLSEYFKVSLTQKKAILNFLYDEIAVFPREFGDLRWDILFSRKLILQYHTQVGKILTLSAKGYAELGVGNRVVSPDSCVEYVYKRAVKIYLESQSYRFVEFQGRSIMVFMLNGVRYYAIGSYRGLRASCVRKAYKKLKPFLISPSRVLVFHPRPYQIEHLTRVYTHLEVLSLVI